MLHVVYDALLYVMRHVRRALVELYTVMGFVRSGEQCIKLQKGVMAHELMILRP